VIDPIEVMTMGLLESVIVVGRRVRLIRSNGSYQVSGTADVCLSPAQHAKDASHDCYSLSLSLSLAIKPNWTHNLHILVTAFRNQRIGKMGRRGPGKE
jgi:hypothetical protein